MTSLPRAKGFNWSNFGVRAASGAVLASASIGAVWVFDWPASYWRAPFLILIAVAGALLSIEWAAMATPRVSRRAAVVTTLAVASVIFLAYAGYYPAAWACVALGALVAAATVRGASVRAIDAAYGVLYIAPACLAIVWLRETLQGRGWILMLFATTWAADIAAFLVGSALKGPKLWPRFSPNKTWTGFCGGLAGAMLASVGIAAFFMRLSLAGAALIGLLAGLATMGGDLWESMLKRRFGVKDSGDLIPGHGGLLDRVDGMMFAVMVFAVARLVVRFGWAH
ncbi:MAG TPA: phosphatidate cytidylyltransferase [Caulobacteraceae bacterium]